MPDELSGMVKDRLAGVTEELKGLIPTIDLTPDVSDADIKQAILDLTSEGMEKLFKQFSQAEVTDFISDFTRGKRW